MLLVYSHRVFPEKLHSLTLLSGLNEMSNRTRRPIQSRLKVLVCLCEPIAMTRPPGSSSNATVIRICFDVQRSANMLRPIVDD